MTAPEAPQTSPPEKPASQESVEALKTLRAYLEAGFLLHGSKSRNDMLEPRQANDTNPERVTGKQFAIYAADGVEIPIFMALIDKKDPTITSMHSGYHGNNGVFRMYGENAALTKGYVYVLPKDTFETESDGKEDSELISRVPVAPIAIIPVQPDIINLLSNVTVELS